MLSTGALYGSMRALACLAGLLPRRVALGLGVAFAGLAWAIYRLTPVRDFVPGNLATAFPDWSEREVLRVGRRSLANLARSIVEVMRFGRFAAEGGPIVTVTGGEHLAAALAAGRGGIVVTAHFGNWELLGATISSRFRPLSVLVQTPSQAAFDRLLREYRRRVGVETFANAGPQALRPFLRALGRGEVVAFLCDQHAEARGGHAVFFGRRVQVPLGPLALARRTGAPVVPARIVRGPGSRHMAEFFPPLDPAAGAQALATLFEDWIREHPDHWLWPHNRFEKADPPGGGIPAWSALRHRRAHAAALALAFLLVWPAPARAAFLPVIVALPDKLAVVDAAHPDTWGTIPLPGRAEATHVVASRQVLVAHVPSASSLCLVDLKPYSPHQYQVFKAFREPALALFDAGIAEVAGKVLLGYGRTPVAELAIARWQLEVGYDRPSAIPYHFSTARVIYLQNGVFTLKDGAVTFESIDRHAHGAAATPVSLRLRHRPTAMVAGPQGRRIYISQAGQGGQGSLAALDVQTREVRREMQVPGPLSSVVWADDRTLAILSGRSLGLVDVARWKLRTWSRLDLPGGTPVRLLPAHAPRVPG